MSQIFIDFLRPDSQGGTTVAQAWAKLPEVVSPAQRSKLKEQAAAALKQHQAVLVAHYYVDADLQDLALETGGCVADSLEMARFGREHPANTLVVAGVRFMGESAKILSPTKRVVMPDLRATCSLDLGCPAEDFGYFCDNHPDRQVVVYANTSAAVKARADWMVTSSCALPIVQHLHNLGHKLIWAPDRHLGRYIQEKTSADMLVWNGACVVHDEFKGLELSLLKEQYPEAKVLVHPESPQAVIALADLVGSTSQLIAAVQNMPAPIFIVATDNGILHRMRQLAPHKILLEAPTAGEGASCKSCAHCPWMAMNALQGVIDCLNNSDAEVTLDPLIRNQAFRSIDNMLSFVKANPGCTATGWAPHLGAA